MHCRVCGTETGVEYRTRSRMFLCAPCHEETPEKAPYGDFLATLQARYPNEGIENDAIMREFYADYKTSTYSDVGAYWDACSA